MGRVFVPPPQIIGAPPPAGRSARTKSHAYMFRFVDIARVFNLSPHKYAYVFLNMLYKFLFYCYV